MRSAAFAWIACLLLPAMAWAGHTSVEAVLDQTAVPPGGSATIALHFKIEPGWHLYWSNPGEAGAPPKVKWTLPRGVTVGDLQFPVPQRKSMSGLIAFVYENDVTLLAKVTLPADAKGTLDLAGHVKVVVCAEECVLEEQDVTVKIPVGVGKANESERFATWRAAQPARPDPPRVVLADTWNGQRSVAVTGTDFLPPKTPYLKFETPVSTPGSSTAPYHVPIRVLSDPSADISGPALIVWRDPAGKVSAEEVRFEFHVSNP